VVSSLWNRVSFRIHVQRLRSHPHQLPTAQSRSVIKQDTLYKPNRARSRAFEAESLSTVFPANSLILRLDLVALLHTFPTSLALLAQRQVIPQADPGEVRGRLWTFQGNFRKPPFLRSLAFSPFFTLTSPHLTSPHLIHLDPLVNLPRTLCLP